jgi:hypothetical protein
MIERKYKCPVCGSQLKVASVEIPEFACMWDVIPAHLRYTALCDSCKYCKTADNESELENLSVYLDEAVVRLFKTRLGVDSEDEMIMWLRENIK